MTKTIEHDRAKILIELKMIEVYFERTAKQAHLYTKQRNRATDRQRRLHLNLNQLNMRDLP